MRIVSILVSQRGSRMYVRSLRNVLPVVDRHTTDIAAAVVMSALILLPYVGLGTARGESETRRARTRNLEPDDVVLEASTQFDVYES